MVLVEVWVKNVPGHSDDPGTIDRIDLGFLHPTTLVVQGMLSLCGDGCCTQKDTPKNDCKSSQACLSVCCMSIYLCVQARGRNF